MIRLGLLILAVALAASVAACGYTPAQLGITGPGTANVIVPSHASEEDQDATIPAPGLPEGFGATYAPSVVPTYGPDGRFYGYN